jgi:ribose 5-phosphate isomerase B
VKIAVGSDHAGLTLKTLLAETLAKAGHEIVDVGTHTRDSVDYPDIALALGRKVAEGEVSRGILVCGTGVGISIAANKVQGVRAVCCSDTFSARMSRAHNDANVLCIGERVVGAGLAIDLATVFIAGEFEGGRHAMRVDKIRQLEGNAVGAGGSKC